MSVGRFEIGDFGLTFADLVNGIVGGLTRFGHAGAPNQLSLPIYKIIQHKSGETRLDCGANPDANAVSFDFFDLPSFGNFGFCGVRNGGGCIYFHPPA